MEIVKKPFAEIDVCPQCYGIFLDRGEGTALHGADSDASFLVEDGRARLVRPSDYACPNGAHAPALMEVFAVGYDADLVEFEHCRTCKGVFLDRSEHDSPRLPDDIVRAVPIAQRVHAERDELAIADDGESHLLGSRIDSEDGVLLHDGGS